MSFKIQQLIEPLLFPTVRLNNNTLNCTIKNKTILITGASYGIGEGLSYKLAIPGVHLILVARSIDKLLQIKNEIETAEIIVSVFQTDLTNPDEILSLIEFIKGNNFTIDIFINNAGKSIRRSIYESLERYHDFTRLMAINYFAPVQLMMYLIPVLEKNNGQVINVSGLNVLLAPTAYWAAYQSSKTAFDNWLRCIIPELNARGVIVSSIYLPLVKTRMIKPTKMYNNMPAMSIDNAVNIICKSINKRYKKFTPWWIFPLQIGTIISRSLFENVSAYYIKKRL